MSDPPKREVPMVLQAILKKDASLTNVVCNVADKILPPSKYNKYYKYLEISCHGLPWLAGNLALLWILWKPNYFQLQINLMFGLLIDICSIAITKAFVRRKRPSANTQDMFLTVGPDQYSFPSGHATRAIFLGYFFTHLYPLNSLWILIIYTWIAAVCISRVLLRRHHILDVIGGVFIGIFDGLLLKMLWLSEPTCASIVNILSEEATNLEGLHDDITHEDL